MNRWRFWFWTWLAWGLYSTSWMLWMLFFSSLHYRPLLAVVWGVMAGISWTAFVVNWEDR